MKVNMYDFMIKKFPPAINKLKNLSETDDNMVR